jgi:excisionase family DNA binding protein
VPSDAKTTVLDVSNLQGSMLSPSQVARLLGVSSQRVIQLANEGKLPCERTPLGRLFDRVDVERLARERAKRRAA